MLWAALHFPGFPVQLSERGAPTPGPLAVATAGARGEVIACNAEAALAGVRPGMGLSAAYALAPALAVKLRDEAAEGQALQGIALWAGQFTPMVSLAPPCAVLAEIGGCLRLFGGLPRLLGLIRDGLAELGYRAAIAAAPTAESAHLLARAGLTQPVTDPAALREALAPLPVTLLNCPREAHETLLNIGARNLRDCFNLPRDGFARRFGQELLERLDRALGAIPDPRPPFSPPARHRSALALPAPAWEAEALLFAARRLVLELAGFLAAREMGLTRLRLELLHEEREATVVTLGFSLPCRDPERILALLRERFAGVELPARVEGIALAAEETAGLAPRSLSFLPDAESAGEGRAGLVERLRARLGEEAVQGLALVADARPELAWATAGPGTRAMAAASGFRPAWLLAAPRALAARDGRPWLDGPLELLAGPERIESGWWDGRDVARDYFLARDPRGARLWVFRERRERGGWYLHGVFA
jgi:protein ImuB